MRRFREVREVREVETEFENINEVIDDEIVLEDCTIKFVTNLDTPIVFLQQMAELWKIYKNEEYCGMGILDFLAEIFITNPKLCRDTAGETIEEFNKAVRFEYR